MHFFSSTRRRFGNSARVSVHAWIAALFLTGLLSVGFAQYPRGGGSQPNEEDVWVRVVRTSTGGRTVTKNNGNTRIQEVITYDANDRPVLKRTYRLNRFGEPSDFLVYNARGTVIYRGEFVYDFQDRLTEERLYTMPGNTVVRRLAYDPQNPKAPPKAQVYGSGVSSDVLQQMAEGGPDRVGARPIDTDTEVRRPAPRNSGRSSGKKKKGNFLNRIFGG
ncbi:MAG: hypothetical protein ACI8UO_004289 [Verrucomicrobiales bacterium]|jgi:hypothetical protein